MSEMMIGLLVAGGVIAVIAMMAIGIYNGLIGKRNDYKNAFAKVDVQLKRRYDLIPNLVETVKGYAQHEEGVYKDIADARAQLLAAKTPEETIQAERKRLGLDKPLIFQFKDYMLGLATGDLGKAAAEGAA